MATGRWFAIFFGSCLLASGQDGLILTQVMAMVGNAAADGCGFLKKGFCRGTTTFRSWPSVEKNSSLGSFVGGQAYCNNEIPKYRFNLPCLPVRVMPLYLWASKTVKCDARAFEQAGFVGSFCWLSGKGLCLLVHREERHAKH